MTNEEMTKEFNNFLKEKNISCKPNPNHYPIINKWNLKYQYNPHKREIFNIIEELLDRRFKNDSTSI